MSFFLREYFNLPDNAFQEGVDTELAAGGTIYQDGTYGYLKTYVVGDGAIIVSEDSLTESQFAEKPIQISISYQLTSLTATDRIYLFSLIQSATQPAIAASRTDGLFSCFLFNNAGTYQEMWSYTAGASEYLWKQSTSSWVTPAAAASFVRTISLTTTYTVTINYHPNTRIVTFTNGTQTASTPALTRAANPAWWLAGDQATGDVIGQLLFNYFYIDDVSVRKQFTLRNSLTKGYQKSSILTLLNDLTTNLRDSFTLKNSILDHDPLRKSFTLLNNIGVEGQLIYLDGSWQTKNIKGKQLSDRATVEIDGIDVSSKVNDWSIDYDDQTLCKTISVTVKDRAYAQSIQPRKYSDSDFDTARIEIKDVSGYSLGQFLIEDKSENAAHKSYSCTLSGRSMTSLLDIPFSDNLQTLYDEATSKVTVVGDLAGDKGLTVQWDIPDSVLPIGALACDDEPPISVIKKIVEAGGGLVYTDRSDNLVCAYKDYVTAGKTPVMSLTSGDIVSVSTSRTVPNGENKVSVEGYQDAALTGGWARIDLEASKTKLKSNGFDSCTITATVWNEDLTVPDVALIEDEEQEPARNDHYEISVSSMIDVDGGGVVSVVKKSDLSLVAGPYEILSDGRTIRTLTAMDDTTYQITYYGGETVSFSVDNYADISPTEVLVKKGKAKATLRASSGGGGFAIVSGDFLDAQTAQLTVQIADPRVGSIEVIPDPSSVSVGNLHNQDRGL